jgi:hypothetical protein
MSYAQRGSTVRIRRSEAQESKIIDVSQWSARIIVDSVLGAAVAIGNNPVTVTPPAGGEGASVYLFNALMAVPGTLTEGQTVAWRFIPIGTEADLASSLTWDTATYNVVDIAVMGSAAPGVNKRITRTAEQQSKIIDVSEWIAYRIVDTIVDGVVPFLNDPVKITAPVTDEGASTYRFDALLAVPSTLVPGQTIAWRFVPTGTEADLASSLTWDTDDYIITARRSVVLMAPFSFNFSFAT